MVYHPGSYWSWWWDDEDKGAEQIKEESEQQQQPFKEQVQEHHQRPPTPAAAEEDWEEEIRQLNSPYGPEDLWKEEALYRMPFHVADRKPPEHHYNPMSHHAPPAYCVSPEEASGISPVEEGQFDDADE